MWVSFSKFTLYVCYFSPNVSISQFEKLVQQLRDSVSSQSKQVIVVGDFNAKGTLWGSGFYDKRGEIVMEWLASDQLVMINDGAHPTFVRGNYGSHLDLTIAKQNIAAKIKNWQVLVDLESLSDHLYITFEVDFGLTDTTVASRPPGAWKLDPRKTIAFDKLLDTSLETCGGNLNAEALSKVIKEACEKSFTRFKDTKEQETGLLVE